MDPEVVFNLWVFGQSVGPMNVIYELGVRPYMMRASDDEMTRLLKELSVSDFHFARRFPLPDRYYLDVSEKDGVFRASSGDSEPTGSNVRKGLALVRPDISGMQQMEYFTEALDVVERTLPTRPLGTDGAKASAPSVNRKNLLSVITTVNVDSSGNQVARVDSPYKAAPPAACVCLWTFNDQRTKAIYAVSGRGYMVHGSNSDKMRVLKALAPHDFQMANVLPIPEGMSTTVDRNGERRLLATSPSNAYSKALFKGVFESIEHEIPAMTGIEGKLKNKVAIKAHDSMFIATQVTEHANQTPNTVSVTVTDGPDPVAAADQVAATPRPGLLPKSATVIDSPKPAAAANQVAATPGPALLAKKSLLQRLFGR